MTLIHSMRLGQEWPWCAVFRITRDAMVERPTWKPDDSYSPSMPYMLAVPAGLWDLLASGLGMRKHAITCRFCGEVEHGDRWCDDRRRELLDRRLCYGCNFWLNYLGEHGGDPNCVRIAGHAYTIEPDPPEGYRGFVGFGGAHFVIVRDTGERIETRNLWHNGDIPARWSMQLPRQRAV